MNSKNLDFVSLYGASIHRERRKVVLFSGSEPSMVKDHLKWHLLFDFERVGEWETRTQSKMKRESVSWDKNELLMAGIAFRSHHFIG